MSNPSKYTLEIATSICEQLAEGKSLRQVCKQPGMVPKKTVLCWLAAHEEFRDMYAEARSRQADHYFEQILEIADEAPATYTDVRGPGREIEMIDNGGVHHAKLRIDARKWVLAKMMPHKYGEKQQLDVQGQVTVVLAEIGEDPTTA